MAHIIVALMAKAPMMGAPAAPASKAMPTSVKELEVLVEVVMQIVRVVVVAFS